MQMKCLQVFIVNLQIGNCQRDIVLKPVPACPYCLGIRVGFTLVVVLCVSCSPNEPNLGQSSSIIKSEIHI